MLAKLVAAGKVRTLVEPLTLTRYQGPDGPVLRFVARAKGAARLRVGFRLPASFQFSYRFCHARSLELPDLWLEWAGVSDTQAFDH